jgi:hypothetical protein
LRHRIVPKAALGRTLDNLMGDRKASPPSDEPAASPGNLSPGVATLLRGGNGAEGTPPEWFGSRGRRRLVQASLFLADVFLAALIFGLLMKIRGPLGFLGLTLCVLALALGAWLACLALWLEKPEDE